MPKPKRARVVVDILREYDARFQFPKNRAKGSELMIYHPDINGRSQSFPMTNHKGKDVRKGMLSAIIRRFNLPKDIFE